MTNKTYAVVHTDTGIVFAENFVRNYSDRPKINNAKLAIMDIALDHQVRECIVVVIVNLSTAKKNMEHIKYLEPGSHIITSDDPQWDYIFLSRDPEALLEKLGIEVPNEE